MKANSDLLANARAYALEALKDQLQAVENAYLQGYNDALETIKVEPIYDGCDTFVDMGLDSGTMWTNHVCSEDRHSRHVGYYDALQYGIPTEEQFEELFSRCKYTQPTKRYSFSHIVGPSSESITCSSTGLVIWVKSDVINDEALTCVLNTDGSHEYVRKFVGEKLHILRVKNKNEE